MSDKNLGEFIPQEEMTQQDFEDEEREMRKMDRQDQIQAGKELELEMLGWTYRELRKAFN